MVLDERELEAQIEAALAGLKRHHEWLAAEAQRLLPSNTCLVTRSRCPHQRYWPGPSGQVSAAQHRGAAQVPALSAVPARRALARWRGFVCDLISCTDAAKITATLVGINTHRLRNPLQSPRMPPGVLGKTAAPFTRTLSVVYPCRKRSLAYSRGPSLSAPIQGAQERLSR